MVRRIPTLSLAVAAGVAIAAPAAPAAAAARTAGPVAHSSGGGAPPINPSIVGVPITRTAKTLSVAADLIDQENGAGAAKPLTAARKYLIRSYKGARTLISQPAPPASASRRVSARQYRAAARRAVRRAHRLAKERDGWIGVHASGKAGSGVAIADNPTAVFNVLLSQYSAATTAAGLYPDTTGTLQGRVRLVLNTSIILRNRIVKAVAKAEPPVASAGRNRRGPVARKSDGPPTYGQFMPGLAILLDDEIQLLQQTLRSVPASAKDDIQKAIAADQKIEALVNQLWPPAPAD